MSRKRVRNGEKECGSFTAPQDSYGNLELVIQPQESRFSQLGT